MGLRQEQVGGTQGLAAMASLSRLPTPSRQQKTMHACRTCRPGVTLLHG